MRPTDDNTNEVMSGSKLRLDSPMAPVQDRFLAFAFDVVLWLPLAFIPARPLWRKFQYLNLVDPESVESALYLAMASFLAILGFAAVQTLFVWKWGATPGKRIMRLRVMNIRTGEMPTLGAACLRSFSMLVELALLALPILEILSQRERRPWHDRLAETKLVTLKDVKSEEPHWLEVRFFRNLYWGSLACLMMTVAIFGTGLIRRADLGMFKSKELTANGYLCEVASTAPAHPAAKDESARIDYALSLYRSGKLSRECVEAEADFAFWTQSEELMPWANLVRGVLAMEDGKPTSEEYFLKACPIGEKGAVCNLSKWFNIHEGIKEAEATSWTGRAEKLRDLMKDGMFESLERYSTDDSWPMDFAGILQEQGLYSSFLQGKFEVFQALHRTLKTAWTENEKMDVAAWSCWAETMNVAGGVTKAQKNPRSTSCVNLGNMMRDGQVMTMPALASLRFEAQTLNLENTDLNQRLKQIATEKSDFKWFSEKLNFKRSLEVLASLKKEDWAANYILGEASLAVKADDDKQKLAEAFKNFSRQKSSWWVAFHSFEKKAPGLFQNKIVSPPIERGLSSVKEDKE